MTREENLAIEFAINNFKAPKVRIKNKKRLADGSFKVRVQDIDNYLCTVYFDKSFIEKCIDITQKGQRHWCKH